MTKLICRLSLAAAIITIAACGPSVSGGEDSGNIGGDPDSSVFVGDIDAPVGVDYDAANSIYPDATDYGDGASGCGTDWMCPNPVNLDCNVNDPDVCGDGADNDCNGEVDDGCSCSAGAVQPCFLGPPGKRNQGACQDGAQTCIGSGEFTYWGPCTGGITPGAEVCDSIDNSCNGCIDDNPMCCNVDLDCPGPGDMPDGAPFQPYVIDGTAFYGGAVASWLWEVSGGPCDQLLDATSGQVTYTLAGQNTSTLTFTPTLSGDYTVTVTITLADNTVLTCTFIVHIVGPGLRIEMCWDTTGSADIDLHAHRSGTTTPWFTTGLSGSNYNTDDCYYMNCKGAAFAPRVDFGPQYVTSPLSECQNGPDGLDWLLYGSCHNPRLDVDNIFTAGIPENVNLDNPLDGETYRVMVHYYGGSILTHPLVNIYCGGQLLGTYGQAPDLVGGFNSGGGFGAGPMWRVVDVTTQVDVNGVTTGCTLDPLHPPMMTSGYWVTNNDRSY